MFRKLRNLLGRPEPVEENLTLSFDGIPAWLDAREAEVEADLSGATEPFREGITATLDALREAVDHLETAGGKEGVHPRLRDISKKALPGFTKSMGQILSREPSGDPETFYETAAEILKGALKAMKGQGKYLSSLYPDEMNGVRNAVRDLGRAINAMTGPITGARTVRRQIDEVRESYEALIRIRGEYTAAVDEVQGYGTALAEMERAIREAGDDLAALKQRPDYSKKLEIEEQIRDLDDAGEEAGREVAVLRTPAVHFFRKAGKVAEKTGDRATATAIDRVLDACTATSPDEDVDPVGLIEAVMPATLVMIRQGDLAIKNQDEVRLFSDPDTLPSGLKRALSRQKEIEGRQEALAETRAALPAVIDEQRLTALLEELEREQETTVAALKRVENRPETMQTAYSEECEQFQSRAAALAGRDVEVDVPPLLPPSS